MGDLLTPMYSMDFDTIEKGTYRFKIKEAKVEPQPAGKTSGKRYWVRAAVVGGSQDGLTHIESFFQNTKDNFSKRKLAGFLIKTGFIKNPANIDASAFDTPEFEQRFASNLVGREFGAKIGHRPRQDKGGNVMDEVQSEMKVYYSLDELLKMQSGGATVTAPAPAAPVADAPAPEAAPAAKPSLWD